MPPKHSQPPPRWPTHVQYLTQPRYHFSVPKHIRDLVCASATAQTAHLHTQKPPVAIQPISDPSHPAHGQYGLFATKKIPPRTLILDYIGEVHCDDRLASDYDLSLYRTTDHISVGVDAQHAGNEARFVNDFRGINQKPNVLFQERRTEGGELRMSVWSGSEPIKKGDELLVSYGKSWWRARQGADNVEAGDEGIEGS
ncbi:SET domain protein [Fomes fomentarius]|nr:SET domain protein [Fomes fomentarius]